MASSLVIVAGLLAANIAIYSLIIFSVLRRKRRSVQASNLADAFRILEKTLKSKFPDMPPGLTWEEVLDRVEVENSTRSGLDVALESYEAYRFGGLPIGESDFSEVLRVANAVGGSKSGRRD